MNRRSSRVRARRPALLVCTSITAIGLGGCGPVLAPGVPAPPAVQRLAAVVDSILATPPFDRAHWGILVHDPATGRPVYALNGDRNFVPASNMKLVTAAVALAELGEEYRYRTTVSATGAVSGDSVADALVVRGVGDPTLSARFHGTRFAALDSLADSVAVSGIRRFREGVVVDASWQADAPLPIAWFLGNLPSSVAAATAAFGIEEGTLAVVLHPGSAPGAPVRAELLPGSGVGDVAIEVTTGPAAGERRIATARRLPGDTLTITGALPLGAPPDTLVLAAPDPARIAAYALDGALRARGIALGAPPTVAPAGSPMPADHALHATPLFTWTSPPLAEIVPAFMRPSQNWISEQLVKTLGAERGGAGSWAAGLDVQGRYLEQRLGLDPASFFLRDGSGLSNQNLLTPAGIVALLEHARAEPWYDVFAAALPRPGQAGGTLSGRLIGLEERVAAKTGTVTHVNGLSGYVRTSTGRDLSFSILTNVTGAAAAPVREAMDRIVREIAEL
jgi:serine-type D-Ala-D-Ala carboxypeptidase/endopeptidase (penicillin-binding protein 4)